MASSGTLACALLIMMGVRGQQPHLKSNLDTERARESVHKDCPPWTWLNTTNMTCECRQQDNNILKCDNNHPNKIQLPACYCLSYYPTLNTTVYGKCIYSCSLSHHHEVWYQNGMTDCKEGFNRTGELCSKCQNGTGHPLYSYKLNCVPCTRSFVTLLLYVAEAYLPLTVFFVVVVAFRISANGATLSGYILMSQIISTPSQLRYISSLKAGKSGNLAINIVITLYAVWNLDFFRALYDPFCYSESTSPLLVASLDYLIALYPMGLILLTFGIVHIHDRFTIVAQLWRPVHNIFLRVRREWDVKKSLVDAFTTFLLLSYIKILNVSFDLLVPTRLYNMTSHPLPNQYYLYYDAGTYGFHSGHIKYGVLAILMLLVFNVAPLLILLLYPCKCFQRLLNSCQCSTRLQAPFHIFMDSFLGCYRIAPRDYRHFAAIYLLVRIGNMVIFSITLSRYYYTFGCALYIGMAALVTVAKPYNLSTQNTINVTLYLLFGFGYLGATSYALSEDNSYNKVLNAFMATASAISVVYPIAVILYHTVLKSLIPRMRQIAYANAQDRHANCTLDCDSDEELFQSLKGRTENTPLLRTPHP